MLLAPWKRHRSRRQPIPEPAPRRWCTPRKHLFSSLLCSSLVSGSLVASTPTWIKHTFTYHRTKSSFRTESCFSSWKKPMEIISIPVTMKPCGRREVPAKWCATWMHQSPPESAWVVTRWQFLMQLGLCSSHSTQKWASRQWMLAAINNYQFRMDSNCDWRWKASPYTHAKCPKPSSLSIALPFCSHICS